MFGCTCSAMPAGRSASVGGGAVVCAGRSAPGCGAAGHAPRGGYCITQRCCSVPVPLTTRSVAPPRSATSCEATADILFGRVWMLRPPSIVRPYALHEHRSVLFLERLSSKYCVACILISRAKCVTRAPCSFAASCPAVKPRAAHAHIFAVRRSSKYE
eukprot:356460-Chlamydomonas_euryale.AAC.15